MILPDDTIKFTFDNLSFVLSSEGQRKVGTAQILMQRVDAVNREVTISEQQLATLTHRPIPQNNIAVQESFRSYRVRLWECCLFLASHNLTICSLTQSFRFLFNYVLLTDFLLFCVCFERIFYELQLSK